MRESKTSRVINSGWTLFVAVLFIGPFALPLLWRNPKFSRRFKTVWTLIIIAITVFCFWALKFSAQLLTNAVAAEPCRFERHRVAYPPGEKQVRVYSGSDKLKSFNNSKEFFDYLKSVDGKKCDVDWSGAKKEIEEWITSGWETSEAVVGPELDALITRQKGAPSATVPTGDTKLILLRTRLNSLKSKSYDSQTTRSAEIDSIIRSLNE